MRDPDYSDSDEDLSWFDDDDLKMERHQSRDSATLLDKDPHSSDNEKPEKAEQKLKRTDSIWGLRFKVSMVVGLSISLVAAVTTSKIHTMHTPPSPPVGFQHSGPLRSTMDIIYSCISTTIICAISVMHFNISMSTAHRLDFWARIRSGEYWEESFRKCVYWTIGLLMPDGLSFIASEEYYEAVEDCSVIQKECPELNWTLKHSFFATMKGFTLEKGDRIKTGIDLLNRGAILDARICNKYSNEISDKSKANLLTKLIAITQITRFLLEEIARAASGLPITPLEYFTCAQVFAALFAYVYWLEKPHGVQEKIRVKKGQERQKRIKHLSIPHREAKTYLVGGYSALLIAASALSSWNVPFPSNGVRNLWKVASVVSAICPLSVIILSWVEGLVNTGDKLLDGFGVAMFSLFFLHCIFRAILFVLIFLSFRNLPPETYETFRWLDFIPFIHRFFPYSFFSFCNYVEDGWKCVLL